MSETTITAKSRLAIFNKMTTATQEVAKAYEEKFGKAAHDIVITQYNLGARICSVIENEGEYGSGAVKQLAEYLAIPGGETTMYALKNFALAFEKDFVKTTMLRPMGNGNHLNIAHWYQLMKLKEADEQAEMVDRVIKESMSAADLEAEIRAGAGGKTKNVRSGGRKPKAPSSPIIGLQKSFQLAQQYNRYADLFEKGVADAIDEIDAEKVNAGLLEKLEKTQETVEDTVKKSTEMQTRLKANIKRVKKILEQKEKEGDGEEAEYTEEAPKKKKKAAKEEEAPKKKKKKKTVAAE